MREEARESNEEFNRVGFLIIDRLTDQTAAKEGRNKSAPAHTLENPVTEPHHWH